jgi:hypothetical protein
MAVGVLLNYAPRNHKKIHITTTAATNPARTPRRNKDIEEYPPRAPISCSEKKPHQSAGLSICSNPSDTRVATGVSLQWRFRGMRN